MLLYLDHHEDHDSTAAREVIKNFTEGKTDKNGSENDAHVCFELVMLLCRLLFLSCFCTLIGTQAWNKVYRRLKTTELNHIINVFLHNPPQYSVSALCVYCIHLYRLPSAPTEARVPFIRCTRGMLSRGRWLSATRRSDTKCHNKKESGGVGGSSLRNAWETLQLWVERLTQALATQAWRRSAEGYQPQWEWEPEGEDTPRARAVRAA